MKRPGARSGDQRTTSRSAISSGRLRALTPAGGRGLGFGRTTGLSVIFLAALVAVTPELIRGNSCGHDFDVHLVSWLDCVRAWQHGIVYPHWTPSPNYGAGEPRFVFYPPFTWILGAALGTVFPWSFAPIALTFLCLAGTGLATRKLALEALDDGPATLAGCTAIFSGFTLFTAYERSAFPEFMGGVWLPLLLLFALRERNPSGPLVRRALDGSTVPLALALAGAWLSNAPLGVIASYLLAAVALVWTLVSRSWAPALRAVTGTVLGLGITAFYWLPAALERTWVDIRQAYEDPGYSFENNWAFARHTNPVLALHDQILHTVSIIAVSMIIVALASLVVCWRRGRLPIQKNTNARFWIPVAAIPVVVLILLFPVSRPIWDLLPQWRFLQYPWRWLEAVGAPTAILFAAAVWPVARQARAAIVFACGAAFLAATVFAGVSFFQVCYPEDTVASTLAEHHTGVGFEGMYEYEPPNADRSLIPMGLPDACLVTNSNVALGKEDEDGNLVWNFAQGSCEALFTATPNQIESNPEHLRFEANVPRAGYLVLRLLSYPSWRVRVNGQLAKSGPAREDGLIVIPVSEGQLDLRVDWTVTADVVLSRWISCIGVLFLVGLFLFEQRRSGGIGPLRSGPRLS